MKKLNSNNEWDRQRARYQIQKEKLDAIVNIEAWNNGLNTPTYERKIAAYEKENGAGSYKKDLKEIGKDTVTTEIYNNRHR